MTEKCRNCDCELEKNLSIRSEESLRKVNIFVCKKCFIERKDDEYSMMTLTNAMKNYALSSEDLSGDQFAIIKKPTSYGRNSFMKLYYKFQVEDVAIKRYGSIENALIESTNIEDKRMQNRINKKFGIIENLSEKEEEKKLLKRIRLQKKIEIENKKRQMRTSNYHEHVFGESVKIIGNENKFLKECKECNFKLVWEEI